MACGPVSPSVEKEDQPVITGGTNPTTSNLVLNQSISGSRNILISNQRGAGQVILNPDEYHIHSTTRQIQFTNATSPSKRAQIQSMLRDAREPLQVSPL